VHASRLDGEFDATHSWHFYVRDQKVDRRSSRQSLKRIGTAIRRRDIESGLRENRDGDVKT